MMNAIMLGMIGMQEVLIIAIVVLLLFGGKKIPELMRGLGAGVKSFKEGMAEGEKPSQDARDTTKANAGDAKDSGAGQSAP